MTQIPKGPAVIALAGGLQCVLLGIVLFAAPLPTWTTLPIIACAVLTTLVCALLLSHAGHRSSQEIALLATRLAQRTHDVPSGPRTDTMILDQLPEPLVVLARDGSIRRMNAAATTLYGDDIASVLRNPTLRAAIDRARSQPNRQTAELSLPVPVPREVVAVVVPIAGPRQGDEDLLLLLSDRTRERAVEQMRSDFVANVSHELRTPLAVLVGFIQTLQGPAADDPPARAHFLGIMAEQSARMNRLIDDLLSLSRIELMEHQPPVDKVDLGKEIARVAASFEPRMHEADLRLVVDVAADLPPVTADADQLVQVLNNLLDNAMKYGASGGTIALQAAPADLAEKRLPSRPGITISVADQGGGIPREHLMRLTERFYRVDKARSQAVGGTGLGLAIVKHIVNRHRGHLLIDSEVGRGTTVRVWLPLPRREAAGGEA
ncbi:MAG: sensor histidine kinase [Acetobacteraceae bacterium]